MPSISFFTDGITYHIRDKRKLRKWISELISNEKRALISVNVVLTSDERLKDINKEFLQHDYYTDIITFQYDPESVSGEIYISLDRIKDNAKENKVSVKEELHRVVAHGFLHMCGYKDKSDRDRKTMRSREDFYLTLRKF